ncbi:MutS domain V [Duganella sp. CF402]|uniref:MutS-related protein n=1 Tax=unclassified Duganella TaxID=2636909 RepID=UPI0008C3D85D|nr:MULTISPECIES: DNA mismatch repair protein MutS [unclassified Duganella]RZT05972.1 MutS-like protein [Duganella sp. BK701]SEN14973.1 MutS domain V [Duganella sp. CF402]
MNDYPFVPSDVALYRRMLPGAHAAIDEQTWNDLLLPAYSAELARETSIFGQQELHRRLYAASADEVSASAGRVRGLMADDARRQQLQATVTDLRRADREISETLYGPTLPSSPRWLPVLAWLPLAFLLSAGMALGMGWMPMWIVALALCLTLCAIQVRCYEAVQEWGRILDSTQLMLRVHSLLPWDDAAQAGKLNRRLSRSLMAGMPGVADYSDWLFLQNVRHYFCSRDVARENIAFLRASFERVATLDADLALARHLSRTAHCWAEAGEAVELKQVVHPLLADAAALDFGMAEQGVFISGQNGVGKSTLLRTVGLNLVTARAFGFCYAARAVTPLLPVYASMQNEDALDSGESFYMAELRRGQELLALSAQRPAIFIIDEIFRGTNYLESVSAAAAVLHTLAAQGRVVVASHHLVLASLLSDCLQPWCVRREGGAWQLTPGLLQDTNGIALLEERGFAPAITTKANRVHTWLSDYLAHPEDQALISLN